ncbi:MAG TPA: SH3 domain-containing protein [Marmoricola sp.]|nr:SH3 domain-containing protein [Marmoricola sp.]
MVKARHRVNARSAARTGFGKLSRVAVLATTVTATVVTAGMVSAGWEGDTVQASPSSFSASAGAAIGSLDLDRLAESRQQRVSRTAKRVTLEPEATDTKFATAPLNVWTEPREHGKRVGLLKWGSKVAVTGQVVGHWSEVLVKKDAVRWVNNDYLADKKPKPKPKPTATASGAATSTGVSTAACSHGSGPEAGLTSDAVEVYRAVCAAFSGVSSYGGYSPRGEHYDGRAVDIMVSGSYGQQIADWLRANAASLQVRDIIYAQRIWTPERAAEGWRYMEDRGSTTANHYDHVHVAVY